MGRKAVLWGEGKLPEPTLIQAPERPADEPKKKSGAFKQYLGDVLTFGLTSNVKDRWVEERENNIVQMVANNTYIFKQPIGLKTFDVQFQSTSFHPAKRIPISGEIMIATNQPIREFCSVYVLWRKCVPNERMLNEDMPETKVVLWTNPEPVKNDQMCNVPQLNLPFQLFAPVNLNIRDFYYEVKIGIGRLAQKGAKPDPYILRKVEVMREETEPLPEYH